MKLRKPLEAGGHALAFGARLTGFLVHEVVQVFSVVSQEFFSSVHTITDQWEQRIQNKAKWSKTKGVYRAALIFPAAFEGVEQTLNQPFTVHRFRVRADPSQCQIIGTCSWNEELPGFPHSSHQLDVIFDFEAQSHGTDVHFEWLVNDFPKSMFSSQYIRIMNSWIEGALGVEAVDE